MARTKYAPTHSSPYCRLYDVSTGMDLVLDGSSVQVLIADVHASVMMSQRFTNTTDSARSALYTFGIMSNAAICGFEMIRQDGTRVEGIVKEKEEARKEYEKAIKDGKTASLGQQETADLFSISVGNISSSETVTINLRYVQPLMDDENKDQIKFIFPRTYAQRYGSAPSYNSTAAKTAHQPFVMDIIVQQAGVIKSISCPSGHPISFEMGLPDGITPPNDDTSHFANVSLSDSSGFLTQDVVLALTAAGLDSPRCFVEPHPSPNHESTAMALTFVPRFTLPDVKGGMEYVFVVDRSGSMQGDNIKLVREALVVLLRGLPSSGTTFNIVSFGSSATKLWDVSRQYSQTSLEEATDHVDAMKADYGGTEIGSALELVFSSLPKPLARPVAVILLTDGGAWDVKSCVSRTETALTSLPQPEEPSSFIRVFTVGIGNGASSDTCDSIARAGAGVAVYVKQGEPVVGKCARLVRAARTPPMKNITVLWTGDEVQEAEDDSEMVDNPNKETLPDKDTGLASALSLFNDDAMPEDHPIGPPPAPDPTLPPPPSIQQAPLVVSNLFPGTRTQIYAILNTPSHEKGVNTMPASIKVKGVVASTGATIELVVPVSQLIFPFKAKSELDPNSSPGTFLHTLAAKALITDRQDGKHALPISISRSFENDPELKGIYMKKEVIRLGTMYQLTSKYTSYIAVDHRLPEPDLIPTSVSDGASGLQMAHQTARRVGGGKAARKQLASSSVRAPPTDRVLRSSSSSSRSLSRFIDIEAKVSDEEESLEPEQSHPLPASNAGETSRRPRTRTTARKSTGGMAPRKQLAVAANTGDSSDERPSKKQKKKSKSSTASSSIPVSATIVDPKMEPEGDQLTAIARLQQFNGALSLSVALLVVLGIQASVQEVEDKLAAIGVSGNVGATVLAWVWMERRGGEEALSLIEKAMDWVKSEVGEIEAVGVREKVLSAVNF